MEFQFLHTKAYSLYNVYHPPRVLNSCNQTGIILCYPIGQEYIRCHKAYIQLAEKLAHVGFHVMRFDYEGIGESSGTFGKFMLQQALINISNIRHELTEFLDTSKTVLMGARIGGYLAMQYSAINRDQIDGLILWNPVINGSEYIDNLIRNYSKWLEGSFACEKVEPSPNLSLFGFDYSPFLVDELRSVILKPEDFDHSPEILLIDHQDYLQVNVKENLTYLNNSPNSYWEKNESDVDVSIVPVFEIDQTVNWVRNRFNL